MKRNKFLSNFFPKKRKRMVCMNYLSVGETSLLIGVSISTLRRWEKDGHFLPEFKTVGNHRRYSISQINDFLGRSKKTDCSNFEKDIICYGRVSSHGQKDDLIRQVEKLKSYCFQKGFRPTIITDIGSGINFNKRGLQKLLHKILNREVKELILTHKDRLLRFGSPLIFSLCRFFDVNIVVLEETERKSFEEELVGDVLELMTVFTSKIYGKRSGRRSSKAA